MSPPLWRDPTEPFDLGAGPRTAILVHGFTGSAADMRYLGRHLSQRGWRTIGVRLPGHTRDPMDLSRATAADWVNEARASLLSLPPQEKVFLVGLSMGALIASIIAADHPERVAALALCAPALGVRFKRAAIAGLQASRLLERADRMALNGPAAALVAALRRRLPHGALPARALDEFSRIRALARLALPRVRCPAIVLFSEADKTVPPSAALRCARLLGQQARRLVRLVESGHVITTDVQREKVATEIEQFFLDIQP